MMIVPASAIKAEVHQLIAVQIETFSQPLSLTSSQLREYHVRFERISALFLELDRRSTRSIRESHLKLAS